MAGEYSVNKYGAYSHPPKPATPEIQELCDMVREPLEKAYRKFILYKATAYRQQLVAGMNYLVNIEVGGEYVHVIIFKALPCNGGGVTLSGYSPNQTRDDPLVPFERQPMGGPLPTNIRGGYSETKPATPEIQELCGMVREPLEKAYRKFILYKATAYRQQGVAGMNYLVNIEVGGEYVHVIIFKALPCYGGGVTLSGYSPNQTRDDPLVPFERQPMGGPLPTNILGAYSETKPATPEIQELCGMIRKPLEKKYRKFTKYVATEYRQQVFAGMNYLVKIKVDSGEYVDVNIFQPLPPNDDDVKLKDYKPHQTANDPLVPFTEKPKKTCMIQ